MKMTTPDATVLVVGAGPTGLTLACELARAGVSHRVIEASSEPQRGSRGKGLQPRTLEVFEDLGVVGAVLAHGRMAMAIRSTGSDGQVRHAGGTVEQRPDVPYPASVITPQWRVEEALRSRLQELGGTVEFGCELRGFDQRDGLVSAVLASGGEEETVTCRWLIGCDGGHSTVRRHAGIGFEGETLDSVRMIVADLEVDGLDREAWQMWRHEDGLVALCPLPSTATFQYQAGIAPGQDPHLSLTNMQAILERRSGRADIRLHEPEWSSLWRANIRLVDRYREKHVLLAGDAAHIHSPAGGQGMNTGIQDAHNLAWKLAAVDAGAAPELLDSYEIERRPVAASVLALSSDRLKQTLKDKGIPIHSDASTMQLGVSYRDSVLVHDDRDEAQQLRAGDRAPDATGLVTAEGERRLHELLGGGHFTLLRFASSTVRDPYPLPDDLRVLRVADTPIDTDQIADPDGHLVRLYDATEATLVLIRPDGYIALLLATGSNAAVAEYIASLGRERTRTPQADARPPAQTPTEGS